MNKVLEFIVDNWIWLGPVVFEIIARLMPTERSLSIINGIKTVADKVIPNIKKNAVTGDVTKHP